MSVDGNMQHGRYRDTHKMNFETLCTKLFVNPGQRNFAARDRGATGIDKACPTSDFSSSSAGIGPLDASGLGLPDIFGGENTSQHQNSLNNSNSTNESTVLTDIDGSCGHLFQATKEWKKPEGVGPGALPSSKRFDEKGLVGMVCRHGILLRYVDIFTGERQSHVTALIEKIFDEQRDIAGMRLCYDVACVFGPALKVRYHGSAVTMPISNIISIITRQSSPLCHRRLTLKSVGSISMDMDCVAISYRTLFDRLDGV